MTSATVDNAISLLDEMNEQGRIEYADYSQLHDAIAATLGRGTMTSEDVRSFLNRNSVFDDTTWPHGRQELVFDEDDLQAMADELNAMLGRGGGELTC